MTLPSVAAIETAAEKHWARLATLPSTNFKTAGVVGLDYLTFAWLMVASLLHKPIDLVVLGSWLGFLASLHGVAYASFAKQRDTDYGALDRRVEIERAKAAVPAPVLPASSPTTNVNVGAVTQSAAATDGVA